ncbi:transporter substrate-binding domain-containing protein [Thalassomonas viridans]|uniref:Transporter substrate-binding domain-containing protein n=1 Tax=Thalassomonas viridans TaxID=137584 RepID=A0AAF0CBZ5_9GAMM|nr:transporter substrate-binding domain-containing protein [Thalassomonas viridans]WDE07756.1 transporter substrate-binding domain-containing protein [Thalassomonas viridans]
MGIQTVALVFMSLFWLAGTKGHAETINYVVIDNQAKPFQIEENSQNHSGIITDIINEIFKGSPYEVRFHTLPFNRMMKMLSTGKIKNWITYGSPSWGGVQAEHLSRLPVYHVEHKLVTNPSYAGEVKAVEDLFGKTLILLHGFDYPGLEPYLKAQTIKEIRVKNHDSAFRLLKRLSDKAGFVEMSLRIEYNLKMTKRDPGMFLQKNFSTVISDYDIHLAMDPDMEFAYDGYVNDRLAALTKDGTLKRIVDSYQ